MGYRHKNSAKHERKLGMAQVGKTLTSAQAKDIADKALPVFEQLDDANDAAFVKTMENWRQNKPQVYEAFWWWRKAHEDAARAKSDDDGTDHRISGRAFEIMQYLAEPFSDKWEPDRRTLKPGVVPFITTEQIEAGLDHRSIKRWAWCWHDRDIYTPEDEVTARPDQPIVAGDRKFKHAHVVIDCPNKQYVDVIARWFGVPENFVKLLRGRGAFLDTVEYLPHESPKAVEQGKTHYDDDEIFASPGFDFRKELTDLQANRAKYGKRAGEMTPADTMRMHVMDDGWTLRDCRRDDPLTYSKIRSTLPPLRLDYLLDSAPCPFRINIYVEGNSGLGKSSFCEALAEALFPAYDQPAFTIGGDERVTFDGYDGEPVIIWEEMRAVDFVMQFKRNGALRLLDTHPKKAAQQAKHSRVILTNALNIINGIESYKDFLDGLAGRYFDKKTQTWMEPEDDTQVYRRMPLIIRVREEDFIIMLNSGFLADDLHGVKQFLMYRRVVGSIKKTMEQLGAGAHRQVMGSLMSPAVEAVHKVEEAERKKITEVSEIPDEFVHYGEVTEFSPMTFDQLDPKEAALSDKYQMYDFAARRLYDAAAREGWVGPDGRYCGPDDFRDAFLGARFWVTEADDGDKHYISGQQYAEHKHGHLLDCYSFSPSAETQQRQLAGMVEALPKLLEYMSTRYGLRMLLGE